MDIDAIRENLDAPGLKVVNVHPIHFVLNTPDRDYYAAHRGLFNTDVDKWRGHAWSKNGTRTLVEAMADFVKRKGYRVEYLYDLFLRTVRELPASIT